VARVRRRASARDITVAERHPGSSCGRARTCW
jgi:hypothetical protein